ncbi:hypothetical protein ACLOJK_013987 [Asimina triloba]
MAKYKITTHGDVGIGVEESYHPCVGRKRPSIHVNVSVFYAIGTSEVTEERWWDWIPMSGLWTGNIHFPVPFPVTYSYFLGILGNSALPIVPVAHLFPHLPPLSQSTHSRHTTNAPPHPTHFWGCQSPLLMHNKTTKNPQIGVDLPQPPNNNSPRGLLSLCFLATFLYHESVRLRYKEISIKTAALKTGLTPQVLRAQSRARWVMKAEGGGSHTWQAFGRDWTAINDPNFGAPAGVHIICAGNGLLGCDAWLFQAGMILIDSPTSKNRNYNEYNYILWALLALQMRVVLLMGRCVIYALNQIKLPKSRSNPCIACSSPQIHGIS